MIDLGLDLSLGVSRASFRLPSFVDCLGCDRPNIARDARLCGVCQTNQPRTPLRRWRWAMDVSLVELEERTGITKRTLLRADRGDRMSLEVARTLARHTGRPWIEFRGENEEP